MSLIYFAIPLILIVRFRNYWFSSENALLLPKQYHRFGPVPEQMTQSPKRNSVLPHNHVSQPMTVLVIEVTQCNPLLAL